METDSTMDRTAGIKHERRTLYDANENVVTQASWIGHTAVKEADRSPIDTQRVRKFYEAAMAADSSQFSLSERPA